MSPSCSWAKCVMPTRTLPSASPGLRIHSCSAVYLRSSGYNGSASSAARTAGRRGTAGGCGRPVSFVLVLRRRASVLRRLRLVQHVDGELVVLVDGRLRVLLLLDAVDDAVGERHGAAQLARLADGDHLVGRLDDLAADR